ncbi:MAG: phosphoglucosamine mutase [Actinomycetota bacterium]|nr:phosphoglucosamine mutase [Actinomycetota bacterium]
MRRRYFGTDGVRGVVGRDLTEELVERLGFALAGWIAERAAADAGVVVGRDTRSSGPVLEAALVRGVVAAGSEVRVGGVLPTPAVALLSASSYGAVVSASHNPPEYNGVKFFDHGGHKLSDEQEEEIETLLDAKSAAGVEPGRLIPDESLGERYVELVCERFGRPLGGLRIAADCANGAMHVVAPAALARLGAEVTAIANEPDGANINVRCGATDLSFLSRTVADGDFDLGVAFDGDGDRMLAVDAAGRELDGDQILTILALHLGVDLVAVTAMTNLGFHRLMREHGIRVVTTDVGDRYVLEALRREGGVLGGEQSGHVVYLGGHTTGDGLVAAILLASALLAEEKTLAELAAVMPRFAQVKENVPVRRKELTEAVQEEVDGVNAELDGRGRVLVRPSGTEPVVRVLAEADAVAAAEALSARIASLVRRELGSKPS